MEPGRCDSQTHFAKSRELQHLLRGSQPQMPVRALGKEKTLHVHSEPPMSRAHSAAPSPRPLCLILGTTLEGVVFHLLDLTREESKARESQDHPANKSQS